MGGESFDDFDTGGDGWMPALEDAAADDVVPHVTVTFEREDDDPFGDCEVTTTAVALPGSSSAIAAEVDRTQSLSTSLALQERQERALALARRGAEEGRMT